MAELSIRYVSKPASTSIGSNPLSGRDSHCVIQLARQLHFDCHHPDDDSDAKTDANFACINIIGIKSEKTMEGKTETREGQAESVSTIMIYDLLEKAQRQT